jgi:hypothetical protein
MRNSRTPGFPRLVVDHSTVSTLFEVRRVRTLSSADVLARFKKEFRRVDLYRLLSVPAPAAVSLAEVASSPRDAGMPGMTDLGTRQTTRFTESIESTDEERSGALLGSVAP